MSKRFSKAILIAAVVCALSVMLVFVATGNARNDDSKINQLIQMSKAGKSTDKIIETARKSGFAIRYLSDEVTLEGKEIWENFVANCEDGISGSVKLLSVWSELDKPEKINLSVIEYVYEDGKYTRVSYELPSGKVSKSDQYSKLVSYYDESAGWMCYFITDSDFDVNSTSEEFLRAVNRNELDLLLSLFYAD